VGIVAGGAGGGLALIKGWNDYNKCGDGVKEYMGKNGLPAMQAYILATKPHRFRSLCLTSDPGKELMEIMTQMTRESDALKNQFSLN
jgi:hypothetical protein